MMLAGNRTPVWMKVSVTLLQTVITFREPIGLLFMKLFLDSERYLPRTGRFFLVKETSSQNTHTHTRIVCHL